MRIYGFRQTDCFIFGAEFDWRPWGMYLHLGWWTLVCRPRSFYKLIDRPDPRAEAVLERAKSIPAPEIKTTVAVDGASQSTLDSFDLLNRAMWEMVDPDYHPTPMLMGLPPRADRKASRRRWAAYRPHGIT